MVNTSILICEYNFGSIDTAAIENRSACTFLETCYVFPKNRPKIVRILVVNNRNLYPV